MWSCSAASTHCFISMGLLRPDGCEDVCEALKNHEGEAALDAEKGDCDYPCSRFFL